MPGATKCSRCFEGPDGASCGRLAPDAFVGEVRGRDVLRRRAADRRAPEHPVRAVRVLRHDARLAVPRRRKRTRRSIGVGRARGRIATEEAEGDRHCRGGRRAAHGHPSGWERRPAAARRRRHRAGVPRRPALPVLERAAVRAGHAHRPDAVRPPRAALLPCARMRSPCRVGLARWAPRSICAALCA